VVGAEPGDTVLVLLSTGRKCRLFNFSEVQVAVSYVCACCEDTYIESINYSTRHSQSQH
jgi:hypothetical protein